MLRARVLPSPGDHMAYIPARCDDPRRRLCRPGAQPHDDVSMAWCPEIPPTATDKSTITNDIRDWARPVVGHGRTEQRPGRHGYLASVNPQVRTRPWPSSQLSAACQLVYNSGQAADAPGRRIFVTHDRHHGVSCLPCAVYFHLLYSKSR